MSPSIYFCAPSTQRDAMSQYFSFRMGGFLCKQRNEETMKIERKKCSDYILPEDIRRVRCRGLFSLFASRIGQIFTGIFVVCVLSACAAHVISFSVYACFFIFMCNIVFFQFVTILKALDEGKFLQKVFTLASSRYLGILPNI